MGFSDFSKGIQFDEKLKGKEFLLNNGLTVTLNGYYFWGHCFGFFRDCNYYYIAECNNIDYILHYKDSDGGEGWFLERWVEEEKEEKLSSFDSHIYSILRSYYPNKTNCILSHEQVKIIAEKEKLKIFEPLLRL